MQIYKTSAEFLGWKDYGVIQTGGIDAGGALEVSGVLGQADKMGKII